MIMGWLMDDYGMVGGARFMDCISLKTFETWDDWFPEKSLAQWRFFWASRGPGMLWKLHETSTLCGKGPRVCWEYLDPQTPAILWRPGHSWLFTRLRMANICPLTKWRNVLFVQQLGVFNTVWMGAEKRPITVAKQTKPYELYILQP